MRADQDQPQRPSTSRRCMDSSTSVPPGNPVVTPEPPTFQGLVFMSCQVLMPEAAQKTQTEGSSVTLPTQVNLVASNCSPTVRPKSFSIGMPRANVPNTVPSLGATL